MFSLHLLLSKLRMGPFTMSEKDKVTVLIVDDHPLFRAGTRERLEFAGESITVVGEAENGERACDQVRALSPSVVLMDIAMTGMNGIEATKIITSTFPEVKVLILSVYDDEQYVRAALKAGASGYLLKTVEAEELVEAIIRVAHGGSALSSSIAKIAFAQISGKREASQLSDRELEVLRLAAHGVSNKEIARELSISTRTVESHMRRIFEKMNVLSRTEAVAQAIQLRWIRLPDVS